MSVKNLMSTRIPYRRYMVTVEEALKELREALLIGEFGHEMELIYEIERAMRDEETRERTAG